MKIFKKIKILPIVILFFAMFFSRDNFFSANASQFEPQLSSYLFHLYYDNGKLSIDRDFQFKYDLIMEPFVQPTITSGVSYRGEVINLLGKIAGSFQFDPRPKSGNQQLNSGKISVKGPYFADAQKINFYNDKNQLLLTFDIASSSICNDNGVCDFDTGENYNNCPADCEAVLSPTPTPITPPIETSIFKWLWYLLGGIVVAIIIFVVFIIIKKRKATNQGQGLPPTQLP